MPRRIRIVVEYPYYQILLLSFCLMSSPTCPNLRIVYFNIFISEYFDVTIKAIDDDNEKKSTAYDNNSIIIFCLNLIQTNLQRYTHSMFVCNGTDLYEVIRDLMQKSGVLM